MKDIINKIKKLLAMSEKNGASENESMMASEKALELLKQHNLSLSDIKDEDQEPIEKETQVVANQISDIAKELFPYSWEALRDE